MKDSEMLSLLKDWLLCFYDEMQFDFASNVEIKNEHCLSAKNKEIVKEWLEK